MSGPPAMRPSLMRVFQVGLCLVIIIYPLSLAYRSRSSKGNEVTEVEVRSDAGQSFVPVGAGVNVTSNPAAQREVTAAEAAADELKVEGLGREAAKGDVEETPLVEEVIEDQEIDRVQLEEDKETEVLEAVIEESAGAVINATSVPNESETNQTETNATEQEIVSPLSDGAPISNASKIVDQIYVVNIPRCVTRWKWVQSVADSLGLPVLRWEATSWQDIDFQNPPLPLEIDWSTQAGNTLKAGELGCLWSHVRLWRHAYENNHQRIIIFEDDVFLNETALPLLEGFFRDADLGAEMRNQSWHYMYLRRWPLMHIADEQAWIENQTSGRVLTIAHPSWGTAAYALSRAGIEWLVNAIDKYYRPLDVQVAKFQENYESTKFIALSACDRDHFQVLCPENVQVIPDTMQGECGGSMSQSGGGLAGPIRTLLRYLRRLTGIETDLETSLRRRLY
ncbi:hypothetical protein KFL_007570040 [Klebsormidium nitens]|uniref:Glycosyl transferase family 25 domain-containing protein n=1 Tax=Klebsormidium nitens TaxID=105231 RepID=A0A1Y1IPY4_KLENI|nr:hypothetical protein KFL_007570040 [Klebsormidium nitens]|eukprot:GAQ91281.1 hypothetical protein KFL_007570040 [Klebsormidium nitens]